MTSPDVKWEPGCVEATQRRRAIGQHGATVWMTGLPAAGKSTLAASLEAHLLTSGRVAFRLDGDNLRHGLNGDLGFAPADRRENVRRTAHVARLFAEAGVIAIVALVSPDAEDRRAARQLHESTGMAFVEVFVDTPLEECERRDPKELYARARRGELPTMTGVGASYDPPAAPELRVTPAQSLAEAVGTVVTALDARLTARPG